MTDIGSKLEELIQQELQRKADKDKHGWSKGRFRSFRDLQLDPKGDIGEDFIVWLLEQSGREASCTPRTDPTNKHWDIVVTSDRITLEVKTATLGYSTPTFQHENLEQNRNCNGIVFLDIAPNDLYITCMCKHTFDWKSAHRRRHGIHYKKDLSLKWLVDNNKRIATVADFAREYEAMLAEIQKHKRKQPPKHEI